MDQAIEKLGETTISVPVGTQFIEPIPESQDEINKQADAAIRDLFPRIPHTDRTMILEHAFRKVTIKQKNFNTHFSNLPRAHYSMASQQWVYSPIYPYLAVFSWLFLHIFGTPTRAMTVSSKRQPG